MIFMIGMFRIKKSFSRNRSGKRLFSILKFYSVVILSFRDFQWQCPHFITGAKLLQKSEMRKNMVMDLIYRGFIYAANYSESHYNPCRSQIKTELRYLFVTTPNR